MKGHSPGKSLMGGILRMTPGLSMCPMQRLIFGSFVSSWHSCFSGEMCLCQPGKESKWTDSSWCECNWRITSPFYLAWLSSLISSGLGRTRASKEQNGAHKGTNLPDFDCIRKIVPWLHQIMLRWRKCGRPNSMRRQQQQEEKLTILRQSQADNKPAPSLAEGKNIFTYSSLLEL